MPTDVETNAAKYLQEKAVLTPSVNLNHRRKGTKYQLIDFQPPDISKIHNVSLNHFVSSQSH